MQVIEVRVWDPLVRSIHWLLAAAVIVDWFTDEPLWMHTWLGYLALALVVLRVVWGFVGPEHARFVSFVRGPRLVFDYLAGLVRFSSQRHLGHSPAGGAMIVALLIMIAATGVTEGALLKGVRFFGEGERTSSVILTLKTGKVRFIESIHLDKGPDVKVRFA